MTTFSGVIDLPSGANERLAAFWLPDRPASINVE